LRYYKSASTGGGIRFGFPIGEKESLGFGLGTRLDNYYDF
jgi:outer membrane protein insertion porin family